MTEVDGKPKRRWFTPRSVIMVAIVMSSALMIDQAYKQHESQRENLRIQNASQQVVRSCQLKDVDERLIASFSDLQPGEIVMSHLGDEQHNFGFVFEVTYEDGTSESTISRTSGLKKEEFVVDLLEFIIREGAIENPPVRLRPR